MDGQWHRAIIENVQQDGQVRIYFIDTGKREFVYHSHLRNLPASFTNLPAQAVFVKLANTAPEVRDMQKHQLHPCCEKRHSGLRRACWTRRGLYRKQFDSKL